MEENKSKKNGGVSLILVIAILVIALAGCITYIMKNNEQKLAINTDNSEKTIKELRTEISDLKNTIAQKENEIENYKNKDAEKDLVATTYLKDNIANLKCQVKYSDNTSYVVYYGIKGENKGYILVDKNGKNVFKEATKKEVIEIHNGYSEIFILFEDGTIGNINLESGKYELKILEEYKNIVRIQEILVGDDVHLALNLMAINSNGEAKKISILKD